MDEHRHHKVGKGKTHMIVAYKEAIITFFISGSKSCKFQVAITAIYWLATDHNSDKKKTNE